MKDVDDGDVFVVVKTWIGWQDDVVFQAVVTIAAQMIMKVVVDPVVTIVPQMIIVVVDPAVTIVPQMIMWMFYVMKVVKLRMEVRATCSLSLRPLM